DGVGSKILDDKGALYTEMYDHVVKISGAGIPCVLDSSITPKCKKILEASVACAKRLGSNFIGTEHILYSICEENDCAGARVLSSIGISTQGIKNDIHSLSEAIANVSSPLKNDIAGAPMLSQFGKSLNSSALLGTIDPLIGRENDVLRLIQILCRRTKNNPCLIGEPGVGKTAIVEGLAQMIVDGRVPKDLEGKIIVSLDLSSVIAGTKYRGEFEERMRAILKEVKNNMNIILFIDEIHVIMGAGGAEGAIDAANIIKPALSRGDLRIIGATTIDEYRKSIEKDSALERRFQPIMIDEPTETEAIEILTGLSPYYEAHHGLKITPEAISACVKLSQRYINDRFLPDKAIDLLDEACSKKRILACSVPESVKSLEAQLSDCVNKKEEAILDRCFSDAIELKDKEACLALELSRARSEYEASKSAPIVDKADIYEVVAIKTKIPVSNALELEDDSLSTLEKRLSESIIGQDEAIRSGLNELLNFYSCRYTSIFFACLFKRTIKFLLL
ncbi:MAG: ATP-dependent Clp protease ATP-binding subunit, partial [Clostridia bacterium]|nr:ATP-dependent Clp protease ATP-binding subunit [Clostridia bacterium]